MFSREIRIAWRQTGLSAYSWFLTAHRSRRVYVLDRPLAARPERDSVSSGPNKLFWRSVSVRRRAVSRVLVRLGVCLLGLGALGSFMPLSLLPLAAHAALAGVVHNPLCSAILVTLLWLGRRLWLKTGVICGVGGLGLISYVVGWLHLHPSRSTGGRGGQLGQPSPFLTSHHRWAAAPAQTITLPLFKLLFALGGCRVVEPLAVDLVSPRLLRSADVGAATCVLAAAPVWGFHVDSRNLQRWAAGWTAVASQAAAHAILTRALQTTYPRHVSACQAQTGAWGQGFTQSLVFETPAVVASSIADRVGGGLVSALDQAALTPLLATTPVGGVEVARVEALLAPAMPAEALALVQPSSTTVLFCTQAYVMARSTRGTLAWDESNLRGATANLGDLLDALTRDTTVYEV